MKSTDFECSDLNGDVIHCEKTSFHEDTKTERQTESASADRRILLGSAFADYNLSRDEPGSEKQTEEECSLGSEPATEVNRGKKYHILSREPVLEGKLVGRGTNGLQRQPTHFQDQHLKL